jgi:hypothetical protein
VSDETLEKASKAPSAQLGTKIRAKDYSPAVRLDLLMTTGKSCLTKGMLRKSANMATQFSSFDGPVRV